MKKLPLVSITITTKNEEKNIKACLESVKKQAYPKDRIEVILVDNHSADKTKQIAKKYTQKVFNKGPERSVQRNFGMLGKSQGKYLMFLDADMRLSFELIKRAVEKLEDNNLVALYLPEIVLGNSFWNRVRRFERSFYNGTVIDCVRFIKKDVFQKVGGFNASLSGPEDWDLDKKIRKIGRVAVLEQKNALIYHDETGFSLKNYLRKKSYYAQSFNRYIKKWGQEDEDIKKQFGFYYRFFGVFIENGKWKKLIQHPILTAGMFFLKILIGGTFLLNKLKD